MPETPHKPELRLVQIGQALELIEQEALETALEEGTDIPDAVLAKISAYLQAQAEHTDEVVTWWAWLEARIAFLKTEEQKIAAIRAQGERFLGSLKTYLQKLIDVDRKGERLEGKVFHIRSQNNSQARLIIDDEKQIPAAFRKQNITFTVSQTDEALGIIEVLKKFALAYKGNEDFDFTMGQVGVNESRVRDVLKTGETVPGARLDRGRHVRSSAPKNGLVKK